MALEHLQRGGSVEVDRHPRAAATQLAHHVRRARRGEHGIGSAQQPAQRAHVVQGPAARLDPGFEPARDRRRGERDRVPG
ncbi:MAG: hypothetical protein KY442_13900, partial [Proteobacteria bacterium]|nr:hypothetical protein [Pseudomonadota bacterium]